MDQIPIKQSPQTPSNVPRWLRRLPNQLTYLRIACIPVVVFFMLDGQEVFDGKEFQIQTTDLIAGLIFSLAALTDFFDGWIARRFGIESLLGKLLDPLADKLLVVSAMIILVEKHRLAGWIAVVLIVRDLGINAIRIAALEENIVISSSWIGKTKTLFLDVGIVALTIYGNLFDLIPGKLVGTIALWCALVASLWSGFQYLWDYARHLKSE
jgi:CDP-diacylglycerol--glycerol-3-phosphate 3-phosphatidyltransferase